ncbi:MAG TPA: ATP-binding protein [Thermodesulfovibrionales bacterium]|nr:ATP-binding protein [Thermodesulfovibrionales bacterium]
MIAKSIDRKILIALSLSVALITAVIIFFTNNRLSKQILEEFTYDSKVTMSVIAAGLEQTMASGKSSDIENQLLDIKAENRDFELFICDVRQRIVFSTDTESLRQPLDHEISNKALLRSLDADIAQGKTGDAVFEEMHNGRRFLMHSHLVLNHSKCYGCHDRGQTVIGAVVLRKPMDQNYAAIAEITRSNILISGIGVIAVILLSHLLITRLVSRPVRELSRSIESLPGRISDGTFADDGEIRREDEIGSLQKAFHEMGIELYEKNHALQKSYADIANANKELESFAYSVSHDLRAPLRNIDGFSKILMDEYAGTLPERAQHYLNRVRNGTCRMSTLIDDILAFSKIGRADLNFRKMSAQTIVKSVLEHYSMEIEARGVKVEVHDLPEINCDTVLMQSLFSNLISNALKYARNTEHPKIEIGYDKAQNAIFIRDNGVGFDMQYHDKIFQIFQRLHLPEEYEGTGIGLAIVKRIAERHHGKVWAESELGKGSTFFIDVPTF